MDTINPDHYKRLPAEAIEIIEAAIGKAPSNQEAYLHGQALKYLLRCWHKNGIEDLCKAKWYLDRLIDSFDESEDQPVIKQSLIPEPPDGWRFLEVGEVIRKGDKYRDLKSQTWIECVVAVGDSLQGFHKPTIRRNQFEVGERVILSKSDDPNIFRVNKHINNEMVLVYCDGLPFQFFANDLAPYIEDAK